MNTIRLSLALGLLSAISVQTGLSGAEPKSPAGAVRAFQAHTAAVTCVAYSPNGERAITGSADGTAKLWEATSLRELLTLRGHTGAILAAAFSPGGDRVLTGSADGTARIWDTASGQEVRTFRGHTSAVKGVAFSPDGQRVLTGSADGTAKIREAATEREIRTVNHNRRELQAVAYSPDGRWLATADARLRIYLSDAETDRKGWLLNFWDRTDTRILAFSPDSRYLATGGPGRTVAVWCCNPVKGHRVLEGDGSILGALGIVFSQDGHRLMFASARGVTKFSSRGWSGLEKQKWSPYPVVGYTSSYTPLRGHTGALTCAAFSPDGRLVFAGSSDGTVNVWPLGQ
jgi:eukaryotic-like serine/threonine-protein kinase